MARVLIETLPWGTVTDGLGTALVGQTVHIANTDATAATTYTAQAGGSSSTSDLTTGDNGAIPGWIEEGEYDVTVGTLATKRVEAVSYVVRDLDVTRYGALPGGTTPEVYIQQAIDAAGANYLAANGKSTTVTIPSGTYTVDLHAISTDTGVAAAFWMKSGVTLRMAPGAIIKLKDSATLPGGTTVAHIISCDYPFGNSSQTKQDYSIWGGVVDGNANNQSTNNVLAGVFVGASKGVRIVGTKAQNVRGTSDTPPAETFHFEVNHSKDVTLAMCEVDGSGVTDTATGFSSDYSYGVTWLGCVAHDMSHGHGFTAYESGGLEYSSCRVYKCLRMGFNWERCDGIAASACIVGGNSPHIATSSANPFFATDETDLHCAYGFNVSGSRNVTGTGCSGRRGTNVGLNVIANTSRTNPAGTATTTNTSNTLTAVTTSAGVWEIEQTVSGAGIPANTKITAVVGSTITMSKNATASATGVAITGAVNSESVHFIGGDFRLNVLDTNVAANQTDVYIRVNTSAGLVSVG